MIPGFGVRGGAEGRAAGRGRLVLPVLLGAFGVFGLFWGTFAVLLADLSGALGLSPGPLGVALFVGAAASIVAMALLGWTSDRLGRRPFLVVSGGVMGLGVAALAFVDGYAVLLAALILLYAASGLYDVGINAAAVDLEKAAGRRFMAVLHAAFSVGGGALGGRAALGRRGLPSRLPRASAAARGGDPGRGGYPVSPTRRASGERRRSEGGGALPEPSLASRRRYRHAGAALRRGDGALVRGVPPSNARALGAPRRVGGRGFLRVDGHRASGSRLRHRTPRQPAYPPGRRAPGGRRDDPRPCHPRAAPRSGRVPGGGACALGGGTHNVFRRRGHRAGEGGRGDLGRHHVGVRRVSTGTRDRGWASGDRRSASGLGHHSGGGAHDLRLLLAPESHLAPDGRRGSRRARGA